VEFSERFAPLPHSALSGPRELSPNFASDVLRCLATDEALVENGALDALIQDFALPQSPDTYQVVCELADVSPTLATLLGGRTGVREGYRLHEHTQAVMNGFEADYAKNFPDPDELKLLRTTLLLQDIGKSLCIAHCGKRQEQARYNAAVMGNLFSAVSEDVLGQDEREAIRLLLGHDVLGGTLKGYKGIPEEEAAAYLSTTEQIFPEKYRARYRHLAQAVYMSDVTAYTSFRSYVASETGQTISCLPSLNEACKVFELGTERQVQFIDPSKQAILGRLTVKLR